MTDTLKQITHTTTGYEVKNLIWKPLDNIIVGMVKCPYANPKLFEGFVCMQWKRNGTPTSKNKERIDLTLKM